jgi:hypothetical protein
VEKKTAASPWAFPQKFTAAVQFRLAKKKNREDTVCSRIKLQPPLFAMRRRNDFVSDIMQTHLSETRAATKRP